MTVMFSKLIDWDVYEISTNSESMRGMKIRGKIRKWGIEQKRNLLVENTEDDENAVRFAVPSGEEVESIISYIKEIVTSSEVKPVLKKTPNPVLSKIKVNHYERY